MTKKYLQEKYGKGASKYTIVAKMLANWWWPLAIVTGLSLFIIGSPIIKFVAIISFVTYSLLSASFTRLDIRDRVRTRNVY